MASLLTGYTLTMFAFYSLVPLVLQWSGAAVLNLSLLTSNLWAALARALLLGELHVCMTVSRSDSREACACLCVLCVMLPVLPLSLWMETLQ